MKFSWVLVHVLIHLSHSSNLVVPVLLFPQFTKGPLRLKDFTYGGGACCWERFEHRQAKTPLPLLWHLLLFPNGSWSLELFVSTSHLLCVRNSLCNCMLTTQFVQYSGSPAEVSCESRITVPFPEMHRTQNCPEWIQTSGAKIHLHRGIRSAIYGSPGARGQFPGEGGRGIAPPWLSKWLTLSGHCQQWQPYFSVRLGSVSTWRQDSHVESPWAMEGVS